MSLLDPCKQTGSHHPHQRVGPTLHSSSQRRKIMGQSMHRMLDRIYRKRHKNCHCYVQDSVCTCTITWIHNNVAREQQNCLDYVYNYLCISNYTVSIWTPITTAGRQKYYRGNQKKITNRYCTILHDCSTSSVSLLFHMSIDRRVAACL